MTIDPVTIKLHNIENWCVSAGLLTHSWSNRMAMYHGGEFNPESIATIQHTTDRYATGRQFKEQINWLKEQNIPYVKITYPDAFVFDSVTNAIMFKFVFDGT
jgi:hypothetical protein